MTEQTIHTFKERLSRSTLFGKGGLSIPLATRLIVSFLFVIISSNIIFTLIGIRLIGDRIVAEAQERVRTDLNSAREIYLGQQGDVFDLVRLTASRFQLWNAFASGNTKLVLDELVRVQENEGLDILSLTDQYGKVVLRTSNKNVTGDDQSQDEIIRFVLNSKAPIAATTIVTRENLRRESPSLADQAHILFIETPKARSSPETEETAGMMIKAAAPIFDSQGNLIGIIYGGLLMNRNYEIVDRIKQTVFQGMKYGEKDIGTATIFQDDVRISTNVLNIDGSRSIGTRIAEDVYNQIFIKGAPWISRAYVVNDWYITAYEPIKNVGGKTIGVLYVGILEQKYLDIKERAVLAFLAISFIGVLASITLAFFISRSISGPVNKLVSASKELAKGNLEAKVEKTSNDELGELADAFNLMATSLKERDEKLKEFARKKVMESEKLALVGQLAANVAHELNNPLQGIVTYSHLLLEKESCNGVTKQHAQKIVTQANRCRDIIRGLLDFARQRKPDKTLCNLNSVLIECLSLLENQALFHNIQIVENLDENLPMVVIDPAQIERVFVNLIVNAADAMEGAGHLTISTRWEQVEQTIEIEFSDTGHGISEENMEKLFDPFFTTKETGHGVGLGLAISYGIVKEHKGVISVESVEGEGTTFIVRLPFMRTISDENNGKQT